MIAQRLPTRGTLGGPGVPPALRSRARTALTAALQSTARWRVMPDTFIIGAQRAGTTSLFRGLVSHPNLAGPRLAKGVHWFDTNFDRPESWYLAHFPSRAAASLVERRTGAPLHVMEGSPYYLFHPYVADRVASVQPWARAIAILRDPVDRAWSHHQHETQRGFETESFARAVELEDERLAGEAERLADPSVVSFHHQHHAYLGRGRYAEQLERWFEALGRERVLVLTTADLAEDPAGVLERVTDFLELSARHMEELPVFNARRYDALDEGLRAELTDYFAPHDEHLAELLGRDLPWRR